MSKEDPHYLAISDWSTPGRAALLAGYEEEARALLDHAFTDFADSHGLAPFGFRGDDPVAEATEWCLERFRSAALSAEQIPSAVQSFRIFTQVRFWLCQKVGRENYQRILGRETAARGAAASERESAGGPSRALLNDCLARLAHTLRALHRRTCSDLVTYWLQGTAALRREWFGWRDPAAPALAVLSKKEKSYYVYHALFRFQCLYHQLLDEDQDTAAVVAKRAFFCPCGNHPPYRCPDSEVAQVLPAESAGRWALARLRRAGAAALLRRLLQRGAQPGLATADRLDWVLLRRSLCATTLHALDLEAEEDLKMQLRLLPEEDIVFTEEEP